ncbi:unnamed protein product, partial [Symbiodinium sp. KB8]
AAVKTESKDHAPPGAGEGSLVSVKKEVEQDLPQGGLMAVKPEPVETKQEAFEDAYDNSDGD